MKIDLTSCRIGIASVAAVAMCAAVSGCGGGTPGYITEQSGVIVSITTTEASRIDTIDKSFTLNGTASSAAEISAVSWINDQGGSGTASGSSHWEAANIPLELGLNTIVITGTDTAGHSGSATIRINRESEGTGSVTLMWQAPTERVDGTPLNDLRGFRVYYGRMSKIYDYRLELRNPGLATYVVENLRPGKWFFAVAAFDADGAESALSNEASTRIL